MTTVLTSPFKSKSRLEAKNVVLRHQLIVSRRKLKGRARLTNDDRWFFVQMYRCFPSILTVVTIVRPETLVRWHRAGFRRYWRWKSNSRIHGELLKLGFNVAQSTVAKYTVKRPGPPSQGGRPFCERKTPCIFAVRVTSLGADPTFNTSILHYMGSTNKF